MGVGRHPNKHVETAISYARSRGWRVEKSSGHAWGRLFCPRADRSGCRISVWSTPRNAESHARMIVRLINSCQCEDR